MSMEVVTKAEQLRDFLEEPDSLEALGEAPEEFVERLKALVDDVHTEAENIEEKIDSAVSALDDAQSAISEIDEAKDDLENLKW